MEHLHKLPSVLPGGCCFALVTSANFYLISVQLCRSDLNFEGRITGQWWIGCIKEGLNYPSPWWQHWPQGKVCVCVSVCVSWPTKSRQREKEGWSALALSTLLAPLQREEGEREREKGRRTGSLLPRIVCFLLQVCNFWGYLRRVRPQNGSLFFICSPPFFQRFNSNSCSGRYQVFKCFYRVEIGIKEKAA